MSINQSLIILRELARSGCKFLYSVATPMGGTEVLATPEQAASIAAGSLQPSGLLGLSDTEYLEWMDLCGHLQCSSNTSTGRRCRNHVTGTAMSDPARWKTLRETQPYCHLHGGE